MGIQIFTTFRFFPTHSNNHQKLEYITFCTCSFHCHFIAFFNVYLFILRERERERERAEEGQRQREGERIPSKLHAVSAEPDAGLKLTNREIVT